MALSETVGCVAVPGSSDLGSLTHADFNGKKPLAQNRVGLQTSGSVGGAISFS